MFEEVSVQPATTVSVDAPNLINTFVSNRSLVQKDSEKEKENALQGGDDEYFSPAEERIKGSNQLNTQRSIYLKLTPRTEFENKSLK